MTELLPRERASTVLREEVLDEQHAGLLALFRVELGRDETSALDGGGEIHSAIGLRRDERRIGRGGEVKVHVIEIRRGAQSLPGRSFRRVPSFVAILAEHTVQSEYRENKTHLSRSRQLLDSR